MAERKLVVVKDNVILPELGGIGGPILTPTRIPIDAILKMINNKRHVFECYPNDPRNESLWVELTNANYKLNNFNKDQEPEQQNTNPEGTSNDGSQNPETVTDPETDPVAPAIQQAPLDPPVSDPDPVTPDHTVDPETEQTTQTNNDEQHTNPESDPEVVTNPEGTRNDGSQNPETVTDPETDPVAPATQSDESQEEEKPATQQPKSSKKNKKK